MKHIKRLFSLCILTTGLVWLWGCGSAATKTQSDYLSTELLEYQTIVADMRELADTLTVNRVVKADSFAYFREIHAMSDAEMDTTSTKMVSDGNILTKLGGTLKSIWPF